MSFVVISSSLNPDSKSRILARRASEILTDRGVEHEFIDLREAQLPSHDGGACYDAEQVKSIAKRIRESEGVFLATPIYNYSASASVVNLIELTGNAWSGKVVGFLCAAGGAHSYMSVMSLANSLMLDFRTIVIPRFVYTDDTAFNNGSIIHAHIEERVNELVTTLVHVGRALANVPLH